MKSVKMRARELATRVSRVLPWIGVLGIIAGLMHCSFPDPAAPKWPMILRLPLMTETFSMGELADTTRHLLVDDEGQLAFEMEQSLKRQYVGDRLRIDAFSEDFFAALGKIRLPAQGADTTNISMAQIFPQSTQLNGQQTVVPGFEIGPLETGALTYQDFLSLKVDSGAIAVTLDNGLAVPLGPPLKVQMIQTSSGRLVQEVTFPDGVQPGQSVTRLVDFAGKILPSDLYLNITGASVGSNGSAILIDADSYFEIQVDVGQMLITEATAKIPEQVVDESSDFSIDDSVMVTEAKIKTGQLDLNIDAQIPVTAMLTFQLPDFVDAAERPFVDSLIIHPQSTQAKQIVLDGYALKPQDRTIGGQKLRFLWTFRTFTTGDDFATVRSTDFVAVEVRSTEIALSSISGIMKETTVNLDTISEEIDMPVDIDSVFLGDAEMVLSLDNTISFPVVIDLHVRGESQSGEEVFLNIKLDESIAPASESGEPTNSVVVLNSENSEIVDFLNAFPSRIEFWGSVTLGGGFTEGRVSEDDWVQGTVRMGAPLVLRLGVQSWESEVDTLDLDAKDQEDIDKYLVSGELIATITNHLPLGTGIEISVAHDSANVFSAPDVVIGPIDVVAGEVNPATGRVSKATTSEITVALTEEQIDQFTVSPLFGGFRLVMPGTEGQTVRVLGSDYVTVGAKLHVQIQVDLESEGN